MANASKRQRIFLLHAEPYAVGSVQTLRECGVDIALCTTRGAGCKEVYAQVLDSDCVQLFSTEARFGQVPAQLPFAVAPATRADLEALAPVESWIVQMLDRMNVDGRSVYDLRQRYIQMVGLWRSFIDALKPDAVVLSSGVPQFGFDMLACELARTSGLGVVLFRGTYLEHRVMPTRGVFDVPGPSAQELADAAPSDGTTSFRTPSNEALNQQAMNVQEIRGKLSRRGVTRALIGKRVLGRISPQPWFLDDPAPTLMKVRWQHFTGRLACRRALEQYDALVRDIDLAAPFVYFPMHTVPEEGTLPLGGAFNDSLHVIRTIAAGLPPGWTLVVREHPNQFNHKYLMPKGRGADFYQRLREISHVVCAPLETPGATYTQHCRAVATISGTTGWEGLQLKKPALVFGHPWYLRAPGVRHLDGLESVKVAIGDIESQRLTVDLELLRRYERAMRTTHTEQLIYSIEFVEWSKITQQQHDANYANAVVRMLKPALATMRKRA